ncbi:MAG: type II/IV secretion system ATPase subunit [Candidatus Hecatellaceae archaeon]
MVLKSLFRAKKPEGREAEKPVKEERSQARVEAEGKPGEAEYYLESYPVNPPFVYVGIVRDPNTGIITYKVFEPTITPADMKILKRLIELLRSELEIPVEQLGSKEQAQKYLRKETLKIAKRYKLKLRKEVFDKIMYYINRDFLGYGKIDPLMHDPLIEDISCDGPKIPVYVWHRDYESMPTNIYFEDEGELQRFILRLAYLAGRHISIAQPIVDAGLPDGSRAHMTFGSEVTKRGSTFTIRKFRADPLSIVDLIKFNTISSDMAAMFWFALEHMATILVAGGTASGKTTTINCLAMFIRPEAKIVTIEDTPELNLPHENWIQSVARVGFMGEGEITLFDLLKAAMRQRPDYIIVGEIRGEEAFTLFQAVSTGHAGLSSIHADSVRAVINRLTTEPMNIPRTMLTGLDYVILQAKFTRGEKVVRRILEVVEITGFDTRTNELLTNQVYTYDYPTDRHIYMGRSYKLEEIAKSRGMTMDEVQAELENRKLVLEWMVKNNIRKYREVAQVVRSYYQKPDEVLRKVRLEMM